jgi:hypothetical protein
MLLSVPGDADDVLAAVRHELSAILDRKRQDVRWKLASARAAFDRILGQNPC